MKKIAYSLMILVAVAIAMIFPDPFVQIGSFEMKLLIVPLLQAIMFGMGTAMSFSDFWGVAQMPRGVLVGVVCQFTIMPFIGFSLAYTFGFPPEIAAGIILVGASPSGLASNVMTYLAKGNIALSVTLTAVATLLAPFLTPFLMQKLAGQLVPIEAWAMMWSIVRIVILPIVAGLLFHQIAYKSDKREATKIILATLGLTILFALISYFTTNETALSYLITFRNFFLILTSLIAIAYFLRSIADVLEKVMPYVSMISIALIIVIITANGRDSLLTIGIWLFIACIIHNLSGYALGYGLCKMIGMTERDCRTISLEVGMQNGGLASGIAVEMGKIATIGLAPAIFGPLMNITGSSLAMYWRNKPIAGEEETKHDPIHA